MSGRWIERNERVLEQIKTMEATKDKDRLELVRSIRFSLRALARSLNGWIEWIGNPDAISKFSQEELGEMYETITNLVKSFIKYDIKITNAGIQKGIEERRGSQRRTTERVFYV
jgi:hypothetical protein